MRWFSLACAAAILSFGSPAWAEQTSPEARASQEFERGRRLFDAEDFIGAAQHFLMAYQILPSASVHFNIARSYELGQNRVLAAQHYRAFLDGGAGSPERRQVVQQRLQSLGQGLAWVTVHSDPEGAEILENRVVRGISPVTLAFVPGQHHIVARGETGRGSRDLTLSEDQQIEVTIPLEPVGLTDPDPGDTHHPENGTDVGNGDGTDNGGQVPGNGQQSTVRRMHPAFFWTAAGLTLGSGVALAVVGGVMLSMANEYERTGRVDSDLAARGDRLEFVTTGLWISTAVLAGVSIIFAIFTNWNRDGDQALTTRSLGWMPTLAF